MQFLILLKIYLGKHFANFKEDPVLQQLILDHDLKLQQNHIENVLGFWAISGLYGWVFSGG